MTEQIKPIRRLKERAPDIKNSNPEEFKWDEEKEKKDLANERYWTTRTIEVNE